jgi:hypothetical protein
MLLWGKNGIIEKKDRQIIAFQNSVLYCLFNL